MTGPIVIRLNPRESECIACGVSVMDPRHGLPMHEGEIVSADFAGEWGGFDACYECWRCYKEGGPAAVRARVRALKETTNVDSEG